MSVSSILSTARFFVVVVLSVKYQYVSEFEMERVDFFFSKFLMKLKLIILYLLEHIHDLISVEFILKFNVMNALITFSRA